MINLAKSSKGYWLTSHGKRTHFKINENFACPCCGCDETDQRLVDKLEILRSRIGKPIYINNCVRCKDRNNKVGGSKYSRHLPIATAIDCTCLKFDFKEFVDIASELFHGIGLYKGKYEYVHLDLRPLESVKYWYRDKNKEYHYYTNMKNCFTNFKEEYK